MSDFEAFVDSVGITQKHLYQAHNCIETHLPWDELFLQFLQVFQQQRCHPEGLKVMTY